MTHFWTKLARDLSAFRSARAGNVAATFALAALPVLGTVGFAVDYSNANSVKAAMQSALDSTALMLSRDAATIDNTALQAKAKAYFDALFTRKDATGVTISANYTNQGGSTVVVNGSAQVPTSLLGVIGYNQITVNGSSTSKWGSTRLRVALVLDTTGSMASDGKMDALKAATKGLLAQLQSAASTNGDVYVSIVPFSKNVNIGPSNFNASYIDWTDWSKEPDVLSSKPSGWDQVGPGDSCPFSNNSHGFVCASGPTSTSTTNTIPSSGTNKGMICPANDSGRKDSTKIGLIYNGCYNSVEKTREISRGSSASCGSTVNCSCSGSGSSRRCNQTYYDHTWVVNNKNTWNGCITDRGTSSGPSANLDRLVSAPGSSAASKYPAEQNSYCSPEVVGLNYNWAAMNSLVNNLYPLGATNQPIGLVWGWQTLVGGGPFTAPAKDPQYTYTDVIVLMSDGMNTLNRWDGNGSSTSTAVDARMRDSTGAGTCANIKAAGITIYTVHVNTDGDPMSTLLKNCASQDDKFWMVTSANGLGDVFSAIGSNLTKLRVAK